MKTNKSYTKRLKITKNGKVQARRAGKNHFNAKESRSTQLNNKKNQTITIKPKMASHMLPGRYLK